ncbi:MAG: glycerophosphodiester phosphodiesterase [Acidobacteria bacterium]|nr:glycerophosphodiester phosphodiesterase [Acidobacteriota bacterium]
MREVWVVAHRGASGYAPENTMAAYRLAVELGANFIEADLHLSRDAKFVALHDTSLRRTTNGHENVHDFTLAELRQLDAGTWFSPAFTGELIPTLEEILVFSREADVTFYLEIKVSGIWGTEHALVAALSEANMVERVVVLSFDLSTLLELRKRNAALMTGYLVDWPYPDMVERAVRAGARQLAPRGDLVRPALIEQARGADLQVVTWTVNEPTQMRELAAMGVHGIMTDYPDRLREVLRAEG